MIFSIRYFIMLFFWRLCNLTGVIAISKLIDGFKTFVSSILNIFVAFLTVSYFFRKIPLSDAHSRYFRNIIVYDQSMVFTLMSVYIIHIILIRVSQNHISFIYFIYILFVSIMRNLNRLSCC